MTALTSELEPSPAHAHDVPDEPPAGVPAVHVAPQPLEFALIRDRAGFDALESDWNALFRRCGRAHQVFQTFAWNWHWSRAFLGADEIEAPGCPIAVLTVRQAGRLVSLWPMTLRRSTSVTELAWMGEPVSQYGDILIDDTLPDAGVLLCDGWRFLISSLHPDLVRLRKVRADAAVAPLLDSLGTLHTSELEAPYVDIAGTTDFATYEARFPNRSKRNRRRQMRRLEEVGAVAFRHLDEGEEAASFADCGIEMKRRWLIDRGHVSPALADVRMARFMTSVAAGGARSCQTRVAVLMAGSTPAAIQIGFTARGTRAMHVIAYDRKFEKMAAGVLHLEESIRHAFDEKLVRIDLLAPKADYKVDWADGAVPVIDHALGLSTRGNLFARFYLGFVRQRLKSGVERMPHRWRQWLVASHLKAAARRFVALFGIG